MKKITIILIYLFLLTLHGLSKPVDIAKLEAELPATEGIYKLKILDTLVNSYLEYNPLMSLKFAYQMLETADNYKFDKYSSNALYSIAVAYKNISNYDSCLHYVKKTLNKIKNQNNPGLVGLCKILLGQISAFNGNVQDSWANYEEALKYFDETKDIKNQVICYLNISYLLSSVKKQDVANEHIKLAENLLQSSLSKTEDIYYLLYLTNLYKSLQMNEKSYGYLAKIEKSPELKLNQSFQIDYYYTLGSLRFSEGKLDEAINFLNQSLTIAETLKNQRKQGEIHNFIGNIYQQINDNRKAKEHYTKSIEIYGSIGLGNYVAEAKVNLASVLNQEGEHDSAFYLIKDLEQIVLKSERKVNYVIYLSLMGDIYMNKNITDKAKYYFNKALSISLEIDDIVQIANSYYSLAEVEKQEKNFPLVLNFLNKALPYAELSKDKPLLKDLYGFLAETNFKLNNFKDAYSFLLKQNNVSNEMALDEIRKNILETEQKKDSEYKEKAINYLKKDQKQNAELLKIESRLKYVFASLAIATFIFFYILNLIRKKSNKALNSKNEELEKINREKDQYLNIIANDLRRAADYVLSLIPKPITDKLKTEWIYIPSEQLGGDSFGYHWIDDHNFAIYLIDVSGHGIKASLHTVSVINALRSHGLPNADMTKPSDVVRCLNDRFQMSAHGDMYFTLWYGVYNNESRELKYSGCGHPPVMIMDGQSDHEIKLLESQNLCVGGVRHPKIQSDSITLELPSTLFVYSDGSYEIKLSDGKYWSDSHFRELLLQYEKKNRTLRDLYAYIKSLNNHRDLDDDLSILKIKIS